MDCLSWTSRSNNAACSYQSWNVPAVTDCVRGYFPQIIGSSQDYLGINGSYIPKTGGTCGDGWCNGAKVGDEVIVGNVLMWTGQLCSEL